MTVKDAEGPLNNQPKATNNYGFRTKGADGVYPQLVGWALARAVSALSHPRRRWRVSPA